MTEKEPKRILLSQHNPAYVEGVYYFEKEYVECEGDCPNG